MVIYDFRGYRGTWPLARALPACDRGVPKPPCANSRARIRAASSARQFALGFHQCGGSAPYPYAGFIDLQRRRMGSETLSPYPPEGSFSLTTRLFVNCNGRTQQFLLRLDAKAGKLRCGEAAIDIASPLSGSRIDGDHILTSPGAEARRGWD